MGFVFLVILSLLYSSKIHESKIVQKPVERYEKNLQIWKIGQIQKIKAYQLSFLSVFLLSMESIQIL